jgi:predicted transglutaminase-like cysteine proteinase
LNKILSNLRIRQQFDARILPTSNSSGMAQMNTIIKAGLVAALVAASLFNASGALANTRGGTVATPFAMKFFCRQNPDECVGGGSGKVALSDDLLVLLKTVNQRVNGSIRYTTERVDKWSLNPARGDCEDFALSKRSALIRQGVPAGALRIAFTYTRRGVPHAVLIVRTSQGDLVLDNISKKVMTLAASGYNITRMSSANPLHWVAG